MPVKIDERNALAPSELAAWEAKYWAEHALRLGRWTIRTGTGRVFYDDREVAMLTMAEEETLLALWKAYPMPVRLVKIIDEMVKVECYHHPSTVKMIIGRLRKKLGAGFIVTVGVKRGYVLSPEAPCAGAGSGR